MAREASIETKLGALRLANKALEVSRAGALQWNESEEDDSFYMVLGPGRVLTVRSDDSDGSHPFTLWIAEQGEILAEVNTLEDQEKQLSVEHPNWTELIEEVYREGRKRGVRANQVIDEMFEELERKKNEHESPF